MRWDRCDSSGPKRRANTAGLVRGSTRRDHSCRTPSSTPLKAQYVRQGLVTPVVADWCLIERGVHPILGQGRSQPHGSCDARVRGSDVRLCAARANIKSFPARLVGCCTSADEHRDRNRSQRVATGAYCKDISFGIHPPGPGTGSFDGARRAAEDHPLGRRHRGRHCRRGGIRLRRRQPTGRDVLASSVHRDCRVHRPSGTPLQRVRRSGRACGGVQTGSRNTGVDDLGAATASSGFRRPANRAGIRNAARRGVHDHRGTATHSRPFGTCVQFILDTARSVSATAPDRRSNSERTRRAGPQRGSAIALDRYRLAAPVAVGGDGARATQIRFRLQLLVY